MFEPGKTLNLKAQSGVNIKPIDEIYYEAPLHSTRKTLGAERSCRL